MPGAEQEFCPTTIKDIVSELEFLVELGKRGYTHAHLFGETDTNNHWIVVRSEFSDFSIVYPISSFHASPCLARP
jgi:hypothetical protein